MQKFGGLLLVQVGWKGLKSRALYFEKTATKTLIFLKKSIFAFLSPKLKFSKMQRTYLSKNSFNIISAKTEKRKKKKSGNLELRFSVYN